MENETSIIGVEKRIRGRVKTQMEKTEQQILDLFESTNTVNIDDIYDNRFDIIFEMFFKKIIVALLRSNMKYFIIFLKKRGFIF